MAVDFIVTLAAIAISGYLVIATGDEHAVSEKASDTDTTLVEIAVPYTLSTYAQVGKTALEHTRAACHGANAVDQRDLAPPLVHIAYEPFHHSNGAFQLTVANGLRGHHWSFASIPPVDVLSRGDAHMVVADIRELQRANGTN